MKRLFLSLLLLTTAMLPAQSIAVSDSGIQNRPIVWKTHNPTDGSQIGGVMPLNYGLLHESVGNTNAMQLYVEGPSWSTMMGYTQRSLYFNQPTGVQLDFDVTVLDANGALLETDMMVVVPVPNTNPQTYTLFNMSLQNLYSTGMLQNVNGGGTWLDIPNAKAGKLSVGKHHYTINGGWNLVANTYGLTGVTLDGTTYSVSQTSVGKPSTWTPGISLQFQITAAPTTAPWTSTSVIIDNINLQQFSN